MSGRPELLTGRYAGFDPAWGVPLRITLGRPRWRLPYTIAAEVHELKPLGLFEEDREDVFTERFRARLDKLGVERIDARLRELGSEHGEADRLRAPDGRRHGRAARPRFRKWRSRGRRRARGAAGARVKRTANMTHGDST